MPIATAELNPDFLLVAQSATVREVRDRVMEVGNSWIYVVVRLADGRYAVLRLAEVVEALQRLSPVATPALLDTSLAEVPDLLEPRAAKPLEQAGMTTQRARELTGRTPGRRRVVTAAGEVIGVLAMEMRSSARGADVKWLGGGQPEPESAPAAPRGPTRGWRPEAVGAAPPETSPPPAPPPPPPAPPPPAPVAARPAPGMLGAEEPAGWTRSEPPPPESEKRWINAELLDHPAGEPLRVGGLYTLAFDVDTELRAGALPGSAPFAYTFAPGEELVELTVQLSSGDFEIHTGPQQLRVPRTGRSRGKARFDVEPTHEGTGVISALFFREGNFVQVLTLKLEVGAVAGAAGAGAAGAGVLTTETMGRPLEAAFELRPRDVGLFIEPAVGGYRLTLTSGVAAWATLPLTTAQLEQMNQQVRDELLGIVTLEVGPNGTPIYQRGSDGLGVEIPPQVNEEALRRLSRTGFRLFQRLFFGPAADAQLQHLGGRLRALAQQERLRIQVVSRDFPLPWALLYLADEYDPARVDPELFLGLKHVIEQVPLQNNQPRFPGTTIDSGPGLTVSLNVNADIDVQMGAPLIAEQLGYWERLRERGGVRMVVRRREQEVLNALADTECEDQILYFYCHAVSRSLSEGGGPDASNLVLSEGDSLTLEELNLYAPLQKVLPCAPLVFINACESAELSPLFYEGFVPYFIAKGARGVIGTECAVPALFAREWARGFFDRFLGGGSLGEVLLELRREFFYEHHNLLGLLYALYCDADTQVAPALQLS